MRVNGSANYEKSHNTSVRSNIDPSHQRHYSIASASFTVSLLVCSTVMAGVTVQTCIGPDAIVVMPESPISTYIQNCLERRLFDVAGVNATFVEADSIEAKRMVETGRAQIALLDGEQGAIARELSGFEVNVVVSNVVTTNNHEPMITAATHSFDQAALMYDQDEMRMSQHMSNINHTPSRDFSGWSVSAIGNYAFELAMASGLASDEGEITSHESGDEQLVRYLRDWTPRATEFLSNQTPEAAQHFHLVGINCV